MNHKHSRAKTKLRRTNHPNPADSKDPVMADPIFEDQLIYAWHDGLTIDEERHRIVVPLWFNGYIAGQLALSIDQADLLAAFLNSSVDQLVGEAGDAE